MLTCSMHYVSRASSKARGGQDKIFLNGDKIRYDRCALGKTEGTEFRNPQAQFYCHSQITKEKGLTLPSAVLFAKWI